MKPSITTVKGPRANRSLRKTEVDKSVRIPTAGAKHVSLSDILPVLSRMS